jgi:hypothetical protein
MAMLALLPLVRHRRDQMKKRMTLSWGIGLVTATAFAASVQAAPPCFENDTDFTAHIWGIQEYNEDSYGVVEPGQTVCASEDVKTTVNIAFLADQPPYVAEISVEPDGVVKVVKDSGGYFLAAFDAEGKQTSKVKLSQPRGG